MGRERGWVSVSVQTYQSHRSNNQRVLQQEYTVEEAGATLNALARNSNAREEEELAAASSQNPSTSIFIRDWKVRSPRARHGLGGLCPSRAALLAHPGPAAVHNVAAFREANENQGTRRAEVSATDG